MMQASLLDLGQTDDLQWPAERNVNFMELVNNRIVCTDNQVYQITQKRKGLALG